MRNNNEDLNQQANRVAEFVPILSGIVPFSADLDIAAANIFDKLFNESEEEKQKRLNAEAEKTKAEEKLKKDMLQAIMVDICTSRLLTEDNKNSNTFPPKYLTFEENQLDELQNFMENAETFDRAKKIIIEKIENQVDETIIAVNKSQLFSNLEKKSLNELLTSYEKKVKQKINQIKNPLDEVHRDCNQFLDTTKEAFSRLDQIVATRKLFLTNEIKREEYSISSRRTACLAAGAIIGFIIGCLGMLGGPLAIATLAAGTLLGLAVAEVLYRKKFADEADKFTDKIVAKAKVYTGPTICVYGSMFGGKLRNLVESPIKEAAPLYLQMKELN